MLISIGVDFRKTPVGTRERLLEPLKRIGSVGDLLPGVHESLSIQTCNRLELYCWSPQAEEGGAEELFSELASHWTRSARMRDEVLARGHARSGTAVTRHLLRVAAGLESQILGDIHILGQLRRAYSEATERGTVGPHLHRLFDFAMHAGKRVRHETKLMEGRRSVGSAAAFMALQRVGDRGRKPRVVLVGCGKVGSHAARALSESPVDLVLMNRTLDRGTALAQDIGGEVAAWERLGEECRRADAIIVATGSDGFVLDSSHMRRAFSKDSLETVIIDLAVPRNVDPAIGRLAGVQLVNLDALNPETAAIEEARQAAVYEAEEIVEEETMAFIDWLAARRASKALEPLRVTLQALCEREIGFTTDAEAASRTASRIVAKMMAAPMEELREIVQSGSTVEPVAHVMRSLFRESPA